MSLGDLLKGLILDSWYKTFVYIGGILLVLSLFYEIKGNTNITNGQLQAISAGVLILGIGEWKNHKQKSGIKPPNVYTGPATFFTWTEWEPDLVGLLFDLIGLIMIVVGTLNVLGI